MTLPHKPPSRPGIGLTLGLIALYAAGIQLISTTLTLLLGPNWLWRTLLLTEASLLWWLWRRLPCFDPTELGLKPTSWREGIRIVLWFQAIAFASDAAVLWLVPKDLVDSYLRLFHPAGPSEWAALATVAILLAPALEELLFRGLLLAAIKRRFGIRAAVVSTTLLFALIHAKPLQVAAALPLGVMLAAYVARGGSLYVTMTAHMLGNAFSFLGLVFPGIPWVSADWRPDTVSGLSSLGIAIVLLGGFLRRHPP